MSKVGQWLIGLTICVRLLAVAAAFKGGNAIDLDGTSSAFDLKEFEERYFPLTVEIFADGHTGLGLSTETYIGERVSSYCDFLHLAAGRCDEIYVVLEKLMFNPRAVVYDINSFREVGQLQPSFPAMPLVERSSRANHEFECLAEQEGGNPLTDCASAADAILKSRDLFFQFSLEELADLQRVVFIHSVLLQAAATEPVQAGLRLDVLESLLKQIVDAPGLLAQVDRIFVINYGHALPANFTQTFDGLCEHKITFYQYSVDITRYEIPTQQTIHYFSRLSRELRTKQGRSAAQVLYLHTKGVSYKQDHPEIRDWRNYMLYFLVERWQNATATLADTAVRNDVVGVYLRPCLCADPYSGREVSMGNYCWTYIGNYWWANADYLSSLPTLAILRNDKYDGEKWITAGYHRRPAKGESMAAVARAGGLVSLHASNVDHYTATYSREMYVMP